MFIAVGVFANTGIAQNSATDQNKTIAILEIITSATSETIEDDSGEPMPELTVKETEFLSAELRRQAVAYFPKDKFNVLTKGQVIDRIPEDTTQDLTNALSVGKAIGADFVTFGTVDRLGKLLHLKVELYDINGRTVLGEFNGEAQDMKGLVDAIRERVPDLFAYIYKDLVNPMQVTVDVKQDTAISSAIQNTQQQMVDIRKKFTIAKGVAIGFDVLAAVAAGIGIYQHIQAQKHYDDYRNLDRPTDDELQNTYLNNIPPAIAKAYDKVEKAKNIRDITFITAGALLVAGITIHITF